MPDSAKKQDIAQNGVFSCQEAYFWAEALDAEGREAVDRWLRQKYGLPKRKGIIYLTPQMLGAASVEHASCPRSESFPGHSASHSGNAGSAAQCVGRALLCIDKPSSSISSTPTQ